MLFSIIENECLHNSSFISPELLAAATSTSLFGDGLTGLAHTNALASVWTSFSLPAYGAPWCLSYPSICFLMKAILQSFWVSVPPFALLLEEALCWWSSNFDFLGGTIITSWILSVRIWSKFFNLTLRLGGDSIKHIFNSIIYRIFLQ